MQWSYWVPFIFQDIIGNLGGLSVIGGMLLDCAPAVKEKALNALNNLSMNIKNQEEIQVSLLQGTNKSNWGTGNSMGLSAYF